MMTRMRLSANLVVAVAAYLLLWLGDLETIGVHAQDDCHESCATCGTYGTDDDCYTCFDDSIFTNVYTDGGGTCTVIPEQIPGAQETQICWMIYQMADNNLESDIRNDFTEITIGSVVATPTITTWIYFDGCTFDDYDCLATLPLQNAYDELGNLLVEKFDGSRYFTWDFTDNKMKVDTIFESELNSDVPNVVQSFVTHAVTDCVAKGSEEYFLVFSSHGSGFGGFGGDDNPFRRELYRNTTSSEKRRRRRLSGLTNTEIANAIQSGLAAVPNGPTKLNLLGFDACLMQSMGAVDEFQSVADYYIASEAVEPGHGWPYNELTQTTSVLVLAEDIVNQFVDSTHRKPNHESPKTLAVIDTSLYDPFLTSWDTLSAEMTSILQLGTDPDFVANLHRSRKMAVAFEAGPDQPGERSAMDVGSFLMTITQLCDPDPTSVLGSLIEETTTNYNAMFLIRRNGPGTPAGTGMHVTWVPKDLFDEERHPFVLDEMDPMITDAPNYVEFLRTYYSTATPETSSGGSVCRTSTEPTKPAETPDDLLIDPQFELLESQLSISSEITRSVDYVEADYGYEVTQLLSEEEDGDDGTTRRRRGRRNLQGSIHRRRENHRSRVESLGRRHDEKEGRERSPSRKPHGRRSLPQRTLGKVSADRRRRIQEEEDFLFFFGGDIFIEYSGPEISGKWDRNYFYVEYEDFLEPVFVFDDGDGAKSIPACYFSPANPVTSDQLVETADLLDAIDNLGCQEAYTTFTVLDGQVEEGSLSLFVYSISPVDGSTNLHAMPESNGGQVAPSLFVSDLFDAYEWVGGLEGLLIPWGTRSGTTIGMIDDTTLYNELETTYGSVALVAYDDDTGGDDAEIYEYDVDPAGVEQQPPTETTTGNPATEQPTTDSGQSATMVNIDGEPTKVPVSVGTKASYSTMAAWMAFFSSLVLSKVSS